MLSSAAFFVVKAMVMPADRTSAATASRVRPRPAGDHDAPDATHTHGGGPPIVKRMFAAVRPGTADAPGKAARGRRRLGRVARAD